MYALGEILTFGESVRQSPAERFARAGKSHRECAFEVDRRVAAATLEDFLVYWKSASGDRFCAAELIGQQMDRVKVRFIWFFSSA